MKKMRTYVLFLLLGVGSLPLLAQQPVRFKEGAEEKKEETPPPVPVATPRDSTKAPASRVKSSRNKKRSLRDRLEFGGNFGLQFGTVTAIQLQPRIGYKVTEDFTAGLGITYVYYNVNIGNGSRYESSIYGGSIFARYRVFDQLFVLLEPEMLNGDVLTVNPLTYEYSVSREWVPALYLGGGLGLGPDGGTQFFVFILYNVLYEPGRSFYGNPVIRVGVGF